jgi:uroporphyrinogen decarboxylase
MKTPGENIKGIFRRQGFDWVPVQFDLCPSQVERCGKETGADDYYDYFQMPWRGCGDPKPRSRPEPDWRKYYAEPLAEGTVFDNCGVAHEPGDASSFHMTRMRHPMKTFTGMEQFKAYPYPDYSEMDQAPIVERVAGIKAKGLLSFGFAGHIWERAWGMRGMEELMMDMMTEEESATWILDKAAEITADRARALAKAGVEMIHFGDDVGMQKSIMMSTDLYRKWLKPRLAEAIKTVKDINKDAIIGYHSCGYIEPFIPDLIEAGVEVLNPVQPECMAFERVHSEYGGVLSFWGALGTQTTFPFGSPQDVRRTVLRNLEVAGRIGGLLCTPTHLVEPEVPWENIMAYVDACGEFSRAGA